MLPDILNKQTGDARLRPKGLTMNDGDTAATRFYLSQRRFWLICLRIADGITIAYGFFVGALYVHFNLWAAQEIKEARAELLSVLLMVLAVVCSVDFLLRVRFYVLEEETPQLHCPLPLGLQVAAIWLVILGWMHIEYLKIF